MDFLLKKSGGLFPPLAKDFELIHNGSVCCVLNFYNWKTVEFLVNAKHYVIRSDGKAQWLLEQGGIELARCKRHASGSKLEFSIYFDDRIWHFKPRRRRVLRTHEVWEESRKIGEIKPNTGLWWPEIGATLEQETRLEIVVFAIWLVGIQWGGAAGMLTAARAEMGI
jgi:hypothetical protein